MEEEKTKKKTVIKIKIPFLLIIAIIIIVLVIPKKPVQMKIKVKSTLEKVVEKSDLETINITYNVIAKKCKDGQMCDKSSNNIDDFSYVASCKGTVTAGIDFQKVKVDVDTKSKKVIVTMPEATLIGEPNILSIKLLNGNELAASEHPNARKLCQETTKEKSENDEKLIPAAKEQSRVVLEAFYKQWIKAYDSSYTVEVR